MAKPIIPITCLEAIAHWRARLANRNKAANTVKAYCLAVIDAAQAFARRDAHLVAVVGAREVEGWLDEMATRQLAVRSQAMKLTAVRRFFEHCLREGWCSANPCRDISIRFHAEPVIAPELPVLLAVIDAIPQGKAANWRDVRDRAILRLAIDAALRSGGITALNLPADREPHTVDLLRMVVTSANKGGGRTQPIAINAQTVTAITLWLERRSDFAKPGETALFVSNRGRRLSRPGLHAIAAARGKAVGVEGLHIHLFRHRRLGGLVETLGLKVASKHAGHRHESTTANVYGAHADNVVRAMVRQHADVDAMARQVAAWACRTMYSPLSRRVAR